MKWNKLGLVFCPHNNYSWMMSHASNPVADYLGNDLFRIYFSTRDKENRASIGFIEIDLHFPTKVLRIAEKPVLRPGPVGTFDDSGISMGCILNHHGKRFLYYMGWNLSVTVPWRNSIGLAVWNDSIEEFERTSNAPIIDRHAVDPFTLSYPWVMHENNVWKMWYGSNLTWGKEHTDMSHVLKYAESEDGINWKREGLVVIDFAHPTEYAFAKPCVLNDKGVYKMWYAYRGNRYRIGYAESQDGKVWVRQDAAVGIDVSSDGWDADSISYPCIFDHAGHRYMLYNGNHYGKTGFGLAIYE